MVGRLMVMMMMGEGGACRGGRLRGERWWGWLEGRRDM